MSDQSSPSGPAKSRAVIFGQLLLILLFLGLCIWGGYYYFASPDPSRHDSPLAANMSVSASRTRTLPTTNSAPTVRDLLKGLNAKTATVSGAWVPKDGSFISGIDPATRIDLGYCPPGEYDLRFTFSRLSGNDGIDTILCYDGRQFIWTMAGWNNTVCGFAEISAQPADRNPTTVKGQWLKNDQRYTCVIKVRSSRVQAFLDDQLISEWSTDYEDLATSSRRLHRTDTLGFSTFESSYAIHSAQIVEIAGKGVARLPDDPLEATSIAIWSYGVADRSPVFHPMFSNGHMKSPEGEELWFLRGDHITFRWGEWVDDCKLAPDRRSFTGSNRSGEKIYGELVSGGL